MCVCCWLWCIVQTGRFADADAMTPYASVLFLFCFVRVCFVRFSGWLRSARTGEKGAENGDGGGERDADGDGGLRATFEMRQFELLLVKIDHHGVDFHVEALQVTGKDVGFLGARAARGGDDVFDARLALQI